MRSDVAFSSLYLDRWLRSGWCLDIAMLLLLGVASLMCRSDSVVFELLGSWVWWWLIWCHLIFDLSYLWYHTGAYPISFRGSWILTDLRDHHLLDAHRDGDMIVYLTEPLRSTQPGPHFSTLGCHHASPSRKTSWIYVHDSVMDSDDQCYMCDDRWFHDICPSDLSRTWCHTRAYFPFQMWFVDLHLCHMIRW